MGRVIKDIIPHIEIFLISDGIGEQKHNNNPLIVSNLIFRQHYNSPIINRDVEVGTHRTAER